MRILVLDGNENQAVAAARSLGRAGHVVEVGDSASWSKAGWSRYARGSFRYPSPFDDAAAFVSAISRVAGRVPGTLVMPMTDRTTLPLSAARAALEQVGASLVLPSHDTVLRAFDKAQTTALAESLGVAVPRTRLLETEADVAVFAASTAYPVVVKPRASVEMSDAGKLTHTGVPRYARDWMEFLRAYDDVRARASAVLVQEFVEGIGVGYFALMRHGELRAEFAHRRIRDVRASGSGSAVRESIVPSVRMRGDSLRILAALQWHGVAMVEYRVRPDGTPVFLEVNGRFWHSLALGICAGVDFPALLATMASEGEVPMSPAYKAGVRCRWLLGDLRHLASVWAGAPTGFAGRWPGRLETLASFVTPMPGTHHDNFIWQDPLPELGDWIDVFGRRFPRALAARRPMIMPPRAPRRTRW